MKLRHLLLPVVFGLLLAASCKEPQRNFVSDGEGGSGAAATGGTGPGTHASGGAGTSTGGAGASTGGASTGDAGAGGTGIGGGADAGAGGEAGATGGACEPDTRRCRGKVPELCDAEGAWAATQTGCAFGCVDGACNDCEPDTKGCENGQSKVCVAGTWQVTPCDNLCEAGDCVDSCTEGARQCDGLAKVQVCTSGAFVDEEECAGICAAGTCIGVCRPDASRCRPGSTTIPELCSAAGQWVAASCGGATPACLGGNCVACTEGATRCSPTGRPQLCNEFGSWVDQLPCATDAPSCVGGQCRLCEPASRRCNAGRPQQCNAMGTAWVNGPVCSGATPACVAATGTCGTCQDGDKQCGSDTTVQTCDAGGRWVESATCSGTTPACLGGSCVACLPAQTDCVGNTPRRCGPNGAWVAQAACSGATPTCVPATGQCACAENAVDCGPNNTPILCTGGTWVPQAQCRGDTPICVGGACQCQTGLIECVSSTEARTCRDGKWLSEVCGATAPICVEGKGCLSCTPNTRRCVEDGSHLAEQCTIDGVWKTAEQCPDFCSRGDCVNPAAAAGVIGCDAPTGLLCKDTHCCYSSELRSICGTPNVKCSAKFVNFPCDGPSDCPEAAPICCASSTGLGTACFATLAACTAAPGVVACDPVRPACPSIAPRCVRAQPNLFTCQR